MDTFYSHALKEWDWILGKMAGEKHSFDLDDLLFKEITNFW